MKPVRVLIVEDSPVVRELLRAIIECDARFEVAGAVASAEEALARIGFFAPDVISLDIRLPGMNGLEATRRIMAERPTPIVVVAARVDSDDLNIAMHALRYGALAVVEKPDGVESAGFRDVAENIRTQLFIMSQVKVVRQRHQALRLGSVRAAERAPAEKGAFQPEPVKALAIGCSTGGPNALTVLLRDLPADLPGPILLVQHLPSAFIPNFAAWIGTICPFPVTMVRDPAPLKAGRIYIAGADQHLTVAAGMAAASAEAPVSGQRPSATVLFKSMARQFGTTGVGVLLTGMGDDGAEGLLEMRKAGAYTIAEDQSTAIVYGMPGSAVALGAASETLPLAKIGPRLAGFFVAAKGAM